MPSPEPASLGLPEPAACGCDKPGEPESLDDPRCWSCGHELVPAVSLRPSDSPVLRR